MSYTFFLRESPNQCLKKLDHKIIPWQQEGGVKRKLSKSPDRGVYSRCSTSRKAIIVSKKVKKKGSIRRFAETNKEINNSHEGEVLKGLFQRGASESLQVSHDGGVLKANAIK